MLAPRSPHVSAAHFSAVVVLDCQHGVGDAVQQAAVGIATSPPGDKQAVEHDLDQVAASRCGHTSVRVSQWGWQSLELTIACGMCTR